MANVHQRRRAALAKKRAEQAAESAVVPVEPKAKAKKAPAKKKATKKES